MFQFGYAQGWGLERQRRAMLGWDFADYRLFFGHAFRQRRAMLGWDEGDPEDLKF
jgi:phenylalanyl-tRNA synthetase alpha subunit